jgi:hypothetical protein
MDPNLADDVVWLIAGVLIGFGIGFSVTTISKFLFSGIKRSGSYFGNFHITYYIAVIMVLIILVLVTR